jgi:hypothetical protein
MNDPQPASPRLRLQQLLAVPDAQRTEAEWDELCELEIMLAPGNRAGAPDPAIRRNGSGQPGHPKPGGMPHGKKPMKKFHRRIRKTNSP